MKKRMKHRVPLLLILCLLCACLPGRLVATAEAEDTKTYLYRLPLSDDDARLDSAWSTKWGHGALTFKNGYSSGASSTSAPIIVTGSYSGNIAYCVEPGSPLGEGGTLSNSSATAVSFWNSAAAKNDLLNAREMQDWVGRILLYGYSGPIQHTRNNGTVTGNGWYAYVEPGVKSTYDWPKMAKAYATQYLIWETVVGERDTGFNYVAPPSGVSSILSQVNANHPMRADILSCYNAIVTSVKQHLTVPSFCTRYTGSAPTHTMTWDGTKYSLTLTDANGVLSNFTFASANGVAVSRSGSTLTLTAASPITGPVTFSSTREGLNMKASVVWASADYQDIVTVGSNTRDPVPAYFKLQTEPMGSISLTKTAEDNNVKDISFTVTGPNGFARNVTTDSAGHWTLTGLKPGSYTVSELVPVGYEPQSPRTVTVAAGQTAEVTFSNVLRTGSITVRKRTADGAPLPNVTLLLQRSVSGGGWTDVAQRMTDGEGNARWEELTVPHTRYRIIELDARPGYSLMTDPIWEGSLPIQIDAANAPPDAELAGENAYVYLLQLTAVNSRITELPFTGSYEMTILPLAMLALCAGILFAKN